MAAKNRALFIDLLKGLALVVMIEVHIFNSLLIPAIKESWWWPSLTFINGLVAPAFTFTSGMVFVLSLQKGADKLREFGKDFWKKLSRIGFIFLAGYALHLPHYSFSRIINSNDFQVWNNLFHVDILQTIASGLLVLLIARTFIKNEKTFFYFTALLTLLILLVGPFIWKIDFKEHIPLFFANYFNKVNNSQFPIFPWWAFIFGGALTAKFFMDARTAGTEKIFARKLLMVGLGFYLVSAFLLYVVFPPSIRFIIPNPFFFLERLGVIFMLLGIGWYYTNRTENYSSILLDVSRESLLVYWVHLQLIYREVFLGKSLWDMYDNKLNVVEAILVTTGLILFMMLLAKGWGFIKTKQPVWARRSVIVIVSLAFIIFMLR